MNARKEVLSAVGARIALIRQERGLSYKAFAEFLGNAASASYLREIERGEKNVNVHVLAALATRGYSADFILTGHAGQEELADCFVVIPKAASKLDERGKVRCPQGTSGVYHAFRKEWLKVVARDSKSLVLVDVEGDSMVPTLYDKDNVLIDLSRTEIRSGFIYAIGVDDVMQIKRLEILPGRIRVVSDNHALFEPFEVSPGEIRVLGQMIWFARNTV